MHSSLSLSLLMGGSLWAERRLCSFAEISRSELTTEILNPAERIKKLETLLALNREESLAMQEKGLIEQAKLYIQQAEILEAKRDALRALMASQETGEQAASLEGAILISGESEEGRRLQEAIAAKKEADLIRELQKTVIPPPRGTENSDQMRRGA